METDLESIIRKNRFTISVIFPLVGALMFLTSYNSILPEILVYNPYLIIFGTLVMRTPLIAGLYPLINRRFLSGLISLTAYSYIIEYIGATTGFPYGQFSYTIELGPMILGKIPLGLPIFFIPLVLNAYLLVTLLYPEKTESFLPRVLGVISAVLVLDLVLDPAAVAVNFWKYAQGVYYGVPLQNYFGWMISATVAVLIIDFSIDREKLVDRLESCEFILDDMVSFVLLWGIINLYFSNILPFLLAVLVGSLLWKAERFNFVDLKP